ncbi:MAG: endolytic transglycosylase MltG [Clostridia bacterium]|nr:endolytic transglycosylase MltG [Clostridia bacterium]
MKRFINITRKNKKLTAILAVILAAVIGFLCFFISVCSDMFITDTDEVVLIDIPQGAGVRSITDLLHEEEVLSHPTVFRIYEKLTRGGVYHSGIHKFYKGMSYEEILSSLETSVSNTVTVTIPEGYEVDQIATLLAEKGVCQKDEFLAATKEEYPDFPYLSEIKREENPLEGYLFPDTYNFERGQAPKSVIYQMLSAFHQKAYSEYAKSNTDKSLDEIIIMASIIEREAANSTEWWKVSSVFYNRLSIGMKLQSCATVQYIIKERKDVLSNADIKIDSPYNTYMYEGLPIGPIASPGAGAINAAIYPEKTDYYYFAATKDGSRNVFTKTGEEHLKVVKELQK